MYFEKISREKSMTFTTAVSKIFKLNAYKRGLIIIIYNMYLLHATCFSVALHSRFYLRDVISFESNNFGNKIIFNNDSTNSLPVTRLPKQETDCLKSCFHCLGWVTHRSYLYKILLLDRFHSCNSQAINV